MFFNIKAPAGKDSISRKQRLKKQLLTVLPVTLPSQLEKKLVTPSDLNPMNMLAVCKCLYCDLVVDLATKFECVNFVFVSVYYGYTTLTS